MASAEETPQFLKAGFISLGFHSTQEKF